MFDVVRHPPSGFAWFRLIIAQGMGKSQFGFVFFRENRKGFSGKTADFFLRFGTVTEKPCKNLLEATGKWQKMHRFYFSYSKTAKK